MAFRLGICALALLLAITVTQRLAAQSDTAQIQTYSEQGQRALAQDNYSDAEQAFEKLRELEPEVAEVHANLGVIYFQERKYDQAVQSLRQALKLKPSLQRPAVLLAISLSETGHYKEAEPGLEKGFRQARDREARRMCGLQLLRAYSDTGNDSKAVSVALDLNRLYPDDPEVLYHTGRAYGSYAFLTMQKLSQVAPGSIWRHQAVAEAAESQEAFDTAISEYRQVLQLDSHHIGIHYRLGRTLMARARQTTSAQDLADAQKEFEEELELDPHNGNAAYEIAEARRNAGQFDEAQKYFERALKFHPDFEEAQLGLASVLMSQQLPQQALPHLKKAIELDPQNEVSWYRLSQAERSLGDNGEASAAMARFQQLHQLKASRDEAGKRFFPTDEVTEQQLPPK